MRLSNASAGPQNTVEPYCCDACDDSIRDITTSAAVSHCEHPSLIGRVRLTACPTLRPPLPSVLASPVQVLEQRGWRPERPSDGLAPSARRAACSCGPAGRSWWRAACRTAGRRSRRGATRGGRCSAACWRGCDRSRPPGTSVYPLKHVTIRQHTLNML